MRVATAIREQAECKANADEGESRLEIELAW